MTEVINRIPLIGESAPAFEATTTQGHVKFPRRLCREMGDLFQSPGGFHPGLHHGIYDPGVDAGGLPPVEHGIIGPLRR